MENPLSADTAMCSLDPQVKNLADARREDPSLKPCFDDAKNPESCFSVDEKNKMLFKCWEHLNFKY